MLVKVVLIWVLANVAVALLLMARGDRRKRYLQEYRRQLKSSRRS